MLADRTVGCWGYNGSGQLGRGAASDTGFVNMSRAAGIAGATSVAAGDSHSCALISDGTVKCWGDNSLGQLGDGTFTPRSTPSTVTGITGALAVAAGGSTSCALITGGAVKCWGQKIGPIRFGTARKVATPVTVTGIAGATRIDVGADHACALAAKGQVQCWGGNAYGQLGDGSASASATPVAAWNLSGASSVSAGDGFTCAGLAAAGIRCWGSGGDGQLGDGRAADSLRPTAVSLNPLAAPTVSATPRGWTNSNSASITFTATTFKTFKCSIDGGPFAACRSPLKLSRLTDGDHSVTISHASPSGDESTATVDWSIDTVKPALVASVVDSAFDGATVRMSPTEVPDDSLVVSAEWSTSTKAPTATAAPATARTVDWSAPLVITTGVKVRWLRIRDGAGNWSAWYPVT